MPPSDEKSRSKSGENPAPIREVLSDADALFFDASRHFEALLLPVRGYLDRDEPARAFPYADRRCRLAAPTARDFVLRSEISRRAGFVAEGYRDLARALDLDPTDRQILRIALTRGEPAQRTLAARLVLSEEEPDRALTAAAVDWLVEDGESLLSCLNLRGEEIVGWAVWTGAAPPQIQLTGGVTRVIDLSPDRDHWLAGEGRGAASIHVALDDECSGAILLRGGRPEAQPRQTRIQRAFSDPALKAADLSIIVPVYEDYEATRACFWALFARGAPPGARIIAIDDATPNRELRDWLDGLAAENRIILLKNSQNLGFAASVNRALALCPSGDVILLNADALPPPGSLGRLRDVVRSAPQIGTATPFSNNGEYVSFPERNTVNPMETPDEIARLDALARRANGPDFVDLPNGIGFCLYISRACLDAVGPLPEIYSRGYYEDVEFCLRAQEKGFRNVCATGVYVGHAGTRSFRADKRRLVMRNLAILERRFPHYHRESASFVEADPLQRARGAIEALDPRGGDRVALVCADGASRLMAQERAALLAREDGPAPLVCSCAGGRAELRGADGAWPQSLDFALDGEGGETSLLGFLDAMTVLRFELFDPLNLSPKLLAGLFRLGARVEIAAGDLQWALPLRAPWDGPCEAPEGARPCSSCAGSAAATHAEGEARLRRLRRKRAILARADAIRPLDRMGAAIARHIFGEAAVLPLAEAAIEATPLEPVAGRALALVVPAPDPLADRFTVALGRALRRLNSEAKIVVLGACVNDLAVMKSRNVFVAGAVKSDEYERLLRQYEISALMSPYRTRFFGPTDRLARAFALPMAYFDYSFGKTAPGAGDLALDPRLCDAKAASLVAQWLTAASPARPAEAPSC